MKEKIKDIIIRALKTFIQGFLATLIVLLKESDYSDLNILKSVIIGAIAGGISAVMNLIINLMQKEEQTTLNEDNLIGDEEDGI